ncbi:hypothetical protein B0J17DRAFT_629228 [Rhizoctonia solani]|nr:hypothetical protein B0J17DRAFT_629228 [Rhizoctonia solani]
MLAMKVAPSIFQQQKLEQEEQNMLQKALEGVPGLDVLIGRSQVTNKPIKAPVTYLSPNTQCNNEVHLLLQQNQLSSPGIHKKGIQLTCWSTQSTGQNGAPIGYNIWLGFNGIALCTCPDFQQWGGACKHMLGSQSTVKEAACCVGLGPGEVVGLFEQTTCCVNKALQGGFLGNLDNIKEEEGDSDSVGDNNTSKDNLAVWSREYESHTPSNSAQGLAEQVTAQTTYNIKQHLNMLPDMHTTFDHITPQAMVDSQHLPIYEKYANGLKAILAQVHGLICSSVPLIASLQRSAQTPTPPQHSTNATLLPL